MRPAIVAAVMAIATPAAAQDSTTTCRNVFGTVTCDTTTTRSGSAYRDAYESRMREGGAQSRAIESMFQRKAERGAQDAAQLAADSERLMRETVGSLVADGRCEEARRYSLARGRFDLAAQADLACKADQP